MAANRVENSQVFLSKGPAPATASRQMSRERASGASSASMGEDTGGMIHFSNTTVSRGQLVGTKAGMQVSKHLHRGTAFVNWSPYAASSSASKEVGRSKALPLRPVRWHVKPRTQASQQPRRKERYKPPTAKTEEQAAPGGTSPTSDQDDEAAQVRSASRGPPISSECIFPVWASAVLPGDLPSHHKRLLHLSVVYWPIVAYPLEEHGLLSHNPLRIMGKYMFLFQDPTSLHCLVALGALYDTLRSGKKESFLLGSLVSKLYNIVGDHIKDHGGMNTTMNAIATLAIIAGYQGNYDHWGLHMKALMQYIHTVGGLEKVDIGVMGGIRKADFAGSLSLSARPFLPWKSRQAKLQFRPEIGRDAMHQGIERHMAPCGIEKTTTEAVAAVASYNRCITYTKRENRGRLPGEDAVVYEPLEIAEHYDYTMYCLLAEPEPLSTTIVPTPRLEQQQQSPNSPGALRAGAPSSADDHTALQSAIRILAILLLRESANDMPCGEDTMIRILEHHLRTLLLGIERTKGSSTRKPIYLWLCIAGDLVSTLQGGVTGGRPDQAGRLTIYQQLLRAVLSADEAADPARVGEADLEVCRIMSLGDMRELKRSSLRASGEEIWDDRRAIRRILGLSHLPI